MSIVFPHVALDKGSVTPYGVFHGLRVGDLPSQEWLDSVQREAQGFSDTDYFVVEGYPTASSDKLRFLSDLSIVPNHAESRPEFYDAFLFDHTDLKLDGVYNEMLSEAASVVGDDISKESGSKTAASTPEIEDIKRVTIDALKARAPAISEEEITRYIEKLFTVRSLLLARTCEYRADAIGHVRFFAGFIHTAEGRRFLEDADFRERYVRVLDRTSKLVYDLNEKVQSSVTTQLRRFARDLPVDARRRLLRMIAYNNYDRILAPRGIHVYSNLTPAS